MSDKDFLSDEFLRQLISVGDVDLLVGLPSHNNSKTIGKVVRAIEEGILRNFRRERVALVNVDDSPRDETARAVREASALNNPGTFDSLRTLRWITASVRGGEGGGNLLRSILTAADLLHSKGCAVLSPSLENPDPGWLVSLLAPVYRENYDFVSPLYSRHKFDGLLARNLLYPFSRAVYGKPMRELRATEFAFSGRLATHCLAEEGLYGEGAQASMEMWVALEAMSGPFRCCQVYLGPKPRPSASAGVVDIIRQTIGGFFSCLESTDAYWLKGIPAEALDTVGADHQLATGAVRVDRKKLLHMYQIGITQLSQILGAILDSETYGELVRMAARGEKEFRFAHALWARISYEFAAAYHHSRLNRAHLVQAFIPLYRGRVYSFLTEHRASSSEAMEADLEELCQEFERQKAFFFDQWTTKGQGAS